MHTCNTCRDSFSDRRKLRRHLRTTHLGDPGDEDSGEEKERERRRRARYCYRLEAPKVAVCCTLCGNYFDDPEDLRRHLEMKLETGRGKRGCVGARRRGTEQGRGNEQPSSSAFMMEDWRREDDSATAKENTDPRDDKSAVMTNDITWAKRVQRTMGSDDQNTSINLRKLKKLAPSRASGNNTGYSWDNRPPKIKLSPQSYGQKLVKFSGSASSELCTASSPVPPSPGSQSSVSLNINASDSDHSMLEGPFTPTRNGEVKRHGFRSRGQTQSQTLHSRGYTNSSFASTDRGMQPSTPSPRRRNGSYNFSSSKTRRGRASPNDEPWLEKDWRTTIRERPPPVWNGPGRGDHHHKAHLRASEDTLSVAMPGASFVTSEVEPFTVITGTKRNITAPHPIPEIPRIVVENTKSVHSDSSPDMDSEESSPVANMEVPSTPKKIQHECSVTSSSLGTDFTANKQLPTPFGTPSPPRAQAPVEVAMTGTARNAIPRKIIFGSPSDKDALRELPEIPEQPLLSLKYLKYRWLPQDQAPPVKDGDLATPVQPTNALCETLEALLVSPKVLEAKGYVTRTWTRQEYEDRKLCTNCRQEKKMFHSENENYYLPCYGHQGELQISGEDENGNDNLRWSCCNSLNGDEHWCTSFDNHSLELFIPDNRISIPTPSNKHSLFAVALDCEMATATDGTRVLTQLSVTDFFSGQVLINRLVTPNKPVASYHTLYSGIDIARMEAAIFNDEAFMTVFDAREELLRFIGPDTIIIGHSAQCDLQHLGISHTRVIDTFVVIPRGPRYQRHGLKELCQRYAGLEVQQSNHDCLEDAYAVRALLLSVVKDREMVQKMKVRVRELKELGGIEEMDKVRQAREGRMREARRGKWLQWKVEKCQEWVGMGWYAAGMARMESPEYQGEYYDQTAMVGEYHHDQTVMTSMAMGTSAYEYATGEEFYTRNVNGAVNEGVYGSRCANGQMAQGLAMGYGVCYY